MIHYNNTESGVSSYEAGDDFLKVNFKSGPRLYTYDLNSPIIIENMKALAVSNKGLQTFIKKYEPAFT